MAPEVKCNLGLFLPRMKACIDEFQTNTSQANYFEGFWKITSKTNSKIEVRKQFESPIRLSLEHMLLKRNEFLPAWPSLSYFLQILAYFDDLYQQIHVCLSLTRYLDGNQRASNTLYRMSLC